MKSSKGGNCSIKYLICFSPISVITKKMLRPEEAPLIYYKDFKKKA